MTNSTLNGVAPLTHLGLIRVQGDDAAKFLHNQLTHDFVLLEPQQARLAGYCSAKGRLLASFIGFKRDATDILLVCPRDVLPAVLKRLSMFVLRAKARLSDTSDAFTVYGLAGAAAQSAFEERAAGADAAWSKHDFDDACLIKLYPADGVARALWVAPSDAAAPAGAALPLALWQWGEVRSGIVLVNAEVVEAFVPQMLNYESVGGVNFKKGCYPGQEVVARSQFRGTLKRRAYLAHSSQPMQAGQSLFVPGDADQPCGLVVQAAPSPAGGWDAVVSIQISAFEAGDLRLDQVDGAPVAVAAPPYPLLADI